MEIVRILIVGLGSIGQRHLRLAREHFPNADIRVLRHQSTSLTPEHSNGCFSCIEQGIQFAPQIAVVANPATHHLGISLPLAQLGTHLLVEKPLAGAVSGVADFLATCNDRGIVLLTGYNLRYLPSLDKFRTLLGQNIIGKVISVRCEIGQFLPTWRPEADYRTGVSARKELGGGALLELSHEIDYLRWIFGEIQWVKASLSRQSILEIDVEDTAHLILGFDPSQDGRQLIASVNLDFVRHDTTRMCVAIGELGTLRWNGISGVVDIFEPCQSEWREIFKHRAQRDDSYIAEWDHFIKCINEDLEPLVSGNDGLQVLKILEAARLASRSLDRVEVSTTDGSGAHPQ
jgi:predicted dehydrogenase